MVALALVTFVAHLVFGATYLTKTWASDRRPSLGLTARNHLRSLPDLDTDNELDSTSYNRAAVTALNTGVPRSREGILFLRAPVSAYFVAASYALGGVCQLSISVVQAALSGLTGLLFGLAARRISGNHRPLAHAKRSSV